MIKSIKIETIPHNQQRYDTLGDWTIDGTTLTILISDSGDWRANACVAMHELSEVLLCVDRGITQKQVDDFDTGSGKDFEEPGDSKEAPYHKEHMAANVVERFMQAQFGMSDTEYERLLYQS
jgi:hypothetical protein